MNETINQSRIPQRNVLVVEDDDGLRRLILKHLQKAGCEAEGVSTGKEAIAYVLSLADELSGLVILLDQNLPDMTGRDMITTLKEKGISVPFVVMTGQGDERLAVDMMKLGAQDYLVKDLGLIDHLPGIFQRLFNQLETEQRLREAEAMLKIAAEEQKILLDNMLPQVWYLTDPDTYGAVNEAHAAFLGAEKEMLAFRKHSALEEGHMIPVFWKGNEEVFRGKTFYTEEWIAMPGGDLKCVSITKNPVFGNNGDVTCAVCSAEDITQRKQAEKALMESQEQIRIQQGKFQKDLLMSFIQILELYDLYTRGHSENVARYSALTAETMNPDSKWIKQVYWAGLVHDIGKLLVPTHILNKPSRLSDEEFEIIKMHPVWGAKVLNTSEQLIDIGNYVLHHHERFDGKGYPDGTDGEGIPLASRIIAVADAFDAMISERAYRKPFSPHKAREELQKNAGTQFDPQIVEVFLSLDLSEVQ